jgi:hypothetical protein
MEPLRGRKPSEMLASMLELCPRGRKTSIFFTHLFLERLPAKLRSTLGEDDHQNVKAQAKKADVVVLARYEDQFLGLRGRRLMWMSLLRWQLSLPVAQDVVPSLVGVEALPGKAASSLAVSK